MYHPLRNKTAKRLVAVPGQSWLFRTKSGSEYLLEFLGTFWLTKSNPDGAAETIEVRPDQLPKKGERFSFHTKGRNGFTSTSPIEELIEVLPDKP